MTLAVVAPLRQKVAKAHEVSDYAARQIRFALASGKLTEGLKDALAKLEELKIDTAMQKGKAR